MSAEGILSPICVNLIRYFLTLWRILGDFNINRER